MMLSEPVKEYIKKHYKYYRDESVLDLTHFTEEKKRNITNEEIIEIASSFLMENPQVTSIEIANLNLSPEAVQALFKAKIKNLSLMSSDVGVKAVSALAKGNLEGLSLIECELTDEVVFDLFLNRSLKKLVLAHNKITGKALEKLADNTSLIWLDLSDNKIEAQYCQYIGKNQSLQILDLSNNKIGDEGLKALSNSSSLEEICLTYGKVTIVCPLNPSLKKLILSNNKISSIEELLKCKPLEKVSLGSNPISEEDYERLKKHYPESAGGMFYGNVSPASKHEKGESVQSQEPKKKKSRWK